jgi:Tfp pilus assembly protein PilF
MGAGLASRWSRAVAAPAVLAGALLAARQSADPVAVGRELFDAGRFDQAEKQFELAVAKRPEDAGAWTMLGQARYAQKLWAKACEAFERVQALAPNDARPLGNVGVCRFSLQQFDAAATAFERAVKLDPTYSRGHLYLARIAAERGADDAAELEFGLAVRSAQPEPLAPFYYGIYLFQARKLDEAAAQFERCLELAPDLPGAHMNLGLIRRRQGDGTDAEAHLRRFRELTEVQIADRKLQLKVTHLLRSANDEIEANRFDSALGAALEAARAAPELPLVHQFLARIYALQGRAADAAREQERFRSLSEKAAGK